MNDTVSRQVCYHIRQQLMRWSIHLWSAMHGISFTALHAVDGKAGRQDVGLKRHWSSAQMSFRKGTDLARAALTSPI